MNVDRLNLDVWSGRVDPEADSPRWHQRIQPLGESQQPGLALLGFVCDEGVRRNQGRVGAASAPAAIRKLLANLAWHRQGPAFDAGDVCCLDGDLDGAQQRLGANVAELLGAGHLPVVLGGGHEVAFGSWQGIAAHLAEKLGPSQERAPRLAIVNFDAHFDLRDPAHIHSSGTPFAQIAEACAARGWPFRYACLGVSRAANTRALFQRAAELDVLVREDFEIRESTLESIGAELDAFVADADAIYLTVDLDVLPAWEGPGVSAPAAHGVSVALLEPLIERLQASGKLLLAELAELNPEHDQDQRTARVAARLIHRLSLHG